MPSLPDLPVEILLAIATTVPIMAALARTNRRLYNVLNPALYGDNISRSIPTKSCILWGAQNGRLGTVKLGHQHGGSLNLVIKDTNWPRSGATKSWNGNSYITNCGTALQLAVRHGHRDIVAYLLDHGADVHAPSLACCHYRSLGRMSYPLHEVVCPSPSELRHYRRRDEDGAVAKNLIRRGAYLEGPGQPVLHTLIVQDRMDLIVPLLGHSRARVWDRACTGDTPLHVAGGFGRTDITRVLLTRGDFNTSALDNAMCTAAEKAAHGGHLSTLRLLLKAESDPGASPSGPARALNAAAASGRLSIVKVLLDEYSVLASERDARGNTPLHLAARDGRVDMVAFLVGRPEVDVNAVCPHGMAAIHRAAKEAPEEEHAIRIIRALVGAGADVNARVPPSGGTPTRLPLRYAIERHAPRVARTLLSLGADPSLENGPDPSTGQSLLHHCLSPEWREGRRIRRMGVRLVKELISKGADIESTSALPRAAFERRADGPPLFFAAAYAESDACVRALLEAGASADVPRIDVPTTFGRHPKPLLMAVFCYRFAAGYVGNVGMAGHDLRLAAVRPAQTCARMLLEYGARLDGGFPGDQSVLEYACEEAADAGGCFELLCVLLSGATRRNVTVEHFEEVRARYAPRASDGVSYEDQWAMQRRERVYRRLSDFGKKTFKQKGVSLR